MSNDSDAISWQEKKYWLKPLILILILTHCPYWPKHNKDNKDFKSESVTVLYSIA